VTISDATPGAVLYCTTDGSTPTSSSPQCSQPTKVFQSEFLQAIAVAPGKAASAVASAGYTISLAGAPVPTFNPGGGSYSSTQSVTISDAINGANIYYTTDGSNPTASSTLYSAPISISANATLNAIAVASGYDPSGVASAAYSITQPVPTPVFSVAPGSYNSPQTVTITDTAQNATIYYAINSTSPSASSTPYSGPITVSQTEIISAVAVLNGVSSPVGIAAYAITAPVGVTTPAFTPGSGAVSAGQTVTITDGDPNAAIYYTTDNSTPTASSTQYSAPIPLSSGTAVISAIAIDGGNSSAVATATYLVGGTPGVPISGTVLSGTSPVSGAQVQLYAAGQSGYGYAIPLGSAAATGSNGSFTISSYTCPASPSDQVYLVATGGNAGNGANSALELMTALGPCGGKLITNNTAVVINELTTVASAYSLAQFMTTAPNVGASPGNYVGLSNAFATVNNLVDITTGDALSITPAYASNTVPFLNTSTAPQMRVNTLGNILNSCASTNGSGSGCSSLWSAATPSSGTAPANTLQAILNIAQHPGVNVTTLFGLAPSLPPFAPALPSAPNDWTLALTFTGGGLGISPSTSGTDSAGDSAIGPTINTSLAIDANGNVWVAGFGESGYPSYTQLIPILAEFNNQGAPQTAATAQSNALTPVITFGGYNLGLNTGSGEGLSAIAVDTNSQIWIGDLSRSGNIYTVSPSLSVLASAVAGNKVFTLTIDNSNNAWVGDSSHLSEFTYVTGNTSLTAGVSGDGHTAGHPTSYGELSGLAFDAGFNLWGYDYLDNTVYQISTTDGTILYQDPNAPGFQAISLAPDNTGNVYACGDNSENVLDVFTATPAPTIASTQTIGTQGCGEQLLLDGQGHLFAISNGIGFPFGSSIDEYTTAGNMISPGTGYTGTSSAEPPTITIDNNLSFGLGYYPTTGAIDGSGNLWLVNADTSNSGGTANPAPTGNVLVEFVGIAAPVVTPTSVALTNGKLGLRP
jgi:hypothetical protein